jgi:outer membrane lipoprotein LolB
VTLWRQAAAAVVALLMAGCASLPRPAADGAALSGRMTVRVESDPVRSLTAAFELGGDADRGQLVLTSPLGTVLALARWSPDGATLATPDGTQAQPDLDTLAEQALGERVPLSAMFDWLRGRPWPHAPHAMLGQGAAGFDQLGWQVDLSRLAEGWVDARRAAPPAVSVRVRLDRG